MPEFGSRFPVLGSPNPSYPALCRQATSCAWRSRPRKAPSLARDAGGDPEAARAKRYAHCVPADMCAKSDMNLCVFFMPLKNAKIDPNQGRAKRYTHCHFGDKTATTQEPWWRLRSNIWKPRRQTKIQNHLNTLEKCVILYIVYFWRVAIGHEIFRQHENVAQTIGENTICEIENNAKRILVQIH